MKPPAEFSRSGASDQLGELLDLVSEAYDVGNSAEPPADEQRAHAEQRQRWLASLRYSELPSVSQEDRRLLATAKAACDRARTVAVSGDSLVACRQIAMAEATTAGRLSNELAGMIAATDVAAAEAAVLYQAGDFVASQERLFTSCRLDATLETEFGLSDLHVHRIHLLGKMVQLLSARKLFAEAMKFGATAVLYVGGYAPPTWPLDEPWPVGEWDTEKPTALPEGLRFMLFQQLAIELGAALLHASPADEVNACRAFAAVFPGSLENLCEDSLARAYLGCRRLAGEPENVAGRLLAAAHLLRHPRRGAETLWLLGALDAARCCALLDHAGAASCRARIFAELSVHTAFPSRLRESWKRLATRHTASA